jgi:hypothetical protein
MIQPNQSALAQQLCAELKVQIVNGFAKAFEAYRAHESAQ